MILFLQKESIFFNNTDSSAWAVFEDPLCSEKLLQGHIHSINAWLWHPWRMSKDSEVASTPLVSLLLSCTATHSCMIIRLCFLCNCALSVAPKDPFVCVLNVKKHTTQLFRFLWSCTIKTCMRPVLMSVCISSAAVQGCSGTYDACDHLPYIIQHHSHYPSDIPSVVLCIALICSHPNLIVSHGLFPVATHKPKLSSVSLK